MKKQTAIEWLFEQVVNRTERVYFLKELEQAKEMERQQITEAYLSGADHVMDVQYNPDSFFNEEQYYNETFKSG